jgi:carbon storage regulator
MLLLSRKQGEAIRIADEIEVRVLEIRKGQVKLGIDGPRHVPVHRQEIYQRIQDAQENGVHVGAR